MPAYKDNNNNTWFVKFRYKDWTGQSKEKKKRGFATKREALAWEENFKVRSAGNLEMSFRDFYEIYKEERFPRLKAVTQQEKKYIIESQILPYFGNRPINDISSADIIRWQNKLLSFRDKDGNPYTKTYLKTIHNQISSILNYAVKHYKLPSNPASIAGNIGSESDVKMKFWTLDEYKAFIETQMYDPIHYYCFQVLYWTGARVGETLALTQSDFDLEARTLSITKTYQVVNGKGIITPPKTPKSNRIIVLPEFLCDEMRDFFAIIPPDRKDDRIFRGATKSSLGRHLKAGADRVGIKKIRIHDLRHSHVSLLINLGYSAVAIADRMGHESIHITYKYAHLFPDTQQEMVDKLNQLALSKPEKGGN